MKRNFKILDILLYPLSLIFALVVWVRNLLFDYKILKSREFDIPVLSVGNLNVGGTGKTPHVEYLIKVLSSEFKVATLSRGYMRKTKGFFLALPDSTPDEIGDEPCQIKHNFPDINVAVDGNRARGIDNLLKIDNNIKAIILDDGFQHRYVTPGLNILLIDYNNSIFDDFILPLGRLREFPSARERADIIIITKCPEELKPIDQRVLSNKMKMYASQKVYFTHMRYGEPVALFPSLAKKISKDDLLKSKMLAISGIANEAPFIGHIQKIGELSDKMIFPDHHNYTVMEMHQLIEKFSAINAKNKYIITTAKDAMKIKQFKELDEEIKSAFYYIPVYVAFHENEEKVFNQYITSYVRNNKPDNILYKSKNKRS